MEKNETRLILFFICVDWVITKMASVVNEEDKAHSDLSLPIAASIGEGKRKRQGHGSPGQRLADFSKPALRPSRSFAK